LKRRVRTENCVHAIAAMCVALNIVNAPPGFAPNFLKIIAAGQNPVNEDRISFRPIMTLRKCQ